LILGTVLALAIVVAMFLPRNDEELDVCPRCGRDFEDEEETTPDGN
jgi:hypothetical protein